MTEEPRRQAADYLAALTDAELSEFLSEARPESLTPEQVVSRARNLPDPEGQRSEADQLVDAALGRGAE